MRRINRRGMALPFVMVFLVVSQLVYFGLIRLNQLNMGHYQLFQQRYQADIQAQLLWNRVQSTIAIRSNIEEQLFEQCSKLNESFVKSKNIELLSDWSEWLIDEGEDTVYVLHYMFEASKEKWNVINDEQNSVAIQEWLSEEGYELKEKQEQSYPVEYQMKLPDINVIFENGQALGMVQNGQYQIVSQVGDIYWRQHKRLPVVKGSIQQSAFMYQKNTDASKDMDNNP